MNASTPEIKVLLQNHVENHLRRRYQLNPNAIVSAEYGVGTSASPGRATGCRT
jgi:hypothetical protein